MDVRLSKEGQEMRDIEDGVCSQTQNDKIQMYVRTDGYINYARLEKFKNSKRKEACYDFIDEEDASNATTCFCTADLCNNIKFKLPAAAKIKNDVG